ncbi:MAG: hypothetical protein HFJ34_01940 [Clostridia bacterium]|nr:hypothetical protein [Clostridia bacterium]
MASFYNNYYRYYRPYFPPIDKQILAEDKPSFKKTHTTVSCEENEKKVVQEIPKISSDSSHEEERSSRYYSFGPINFKNPLFNDIEEPIFEILGIKLYLDDIIILGLLFFLYQEGVQDQMLYMALVLLLLS